VKVTASATKKGKRGPTRKSAVRKFFCSGKIINSDSNQEGLKEKHSDALTDHRVLGSRRTKPGRSPEGSYQRSVIKGLSQKGGGTNSITSKGAIENESWKEEGGEGEFTHDIKLSSTKYAHGVREKTSSTVPGFGRVGKNRDALRSQSRFCRK